MKKVEVNIPGKNYPVLIEQHLFDRLEKIILSKKSNKNLFIVIDRKVFELHRTKIIRFVSNFPGKYFIHEFDSDESNKSFTSVDKMYSNLILQKFGRDTLMLAIGGGIAGDIAGFVASTFARGIQFIQIPTTLLAAVDSSIGGKTGINFSETKNIIGTFYQPEMVLIDTGFLKTLPEEEIICGIGEILKYAFLIDQKFFVTLRNNLSKLIKLDTSFTSKIIESCLQFKGDVVVADEKEGSLRKILNLGHTFAHAIEIEQNYRIKHGKAVIVGLVCALDLSRRMEILDKKLFEEYLQLPLLLRNFISIDNFNAEHIYEVMKRDKKGINNSIKFVLISSIGEILVDVAAEEGEVLQSIQQGIGYFKK